MLITDIARDNWLLLFTVNDSRYALQLEPEMLETVTRTESITEFGYMSTSPDEPTHQHTYHPYLGELTEDDMEFIITRYQKDAQQTD